MSESLNSAQDDNWFIWNGALGVRVSVEIGDVETDATGRKAWLEDPYDMVGPFSLDDLESNGYINFAACTVMSEHYWQQNQTTIRQQSQVQRRASQKQMFEEMKRYNQRRQFQTGGFQQYDDKKHRASLDLPAEGELKVAQVKAAYRKLAQKLHPDVGGSQDAFVQITKARDALLACLA